MKKWTVAVVGATGLVGRKMLDVLTERNFPVGRLVPIASANSAGQTAHFHGEEIPVQVISEDVFNGVDIALFSAGGSVSKTYAPIAARAGAVVVDNSSAWRMDPDVPLVVPEVNPAALENHNGIIANPNCSTIQMVVALQSLHEKYRIRRIVVSTYQSVSGSGKKAMQQLADEISGDTVADPAYPHPIAYNCLPHIDVFFEDGYSREEHKMIFETRKIMGDDNIQVSPTTVRVPVSAGHSEAINLEFENPFELDEVRSLLANAPGVVLQDDPHNNIYPMPLEAADKDAVFVGRLRRDPSITNGLNLWVVSDNLRKGAATNTVQIAEVLIEKNALVLTD